MESNVDAAEWKLELERVMPMLKVHIRTDNKVNVIVYTLEKYTFILSLWLFLKLFAFAFRIMHQYFSWV